MATHKPRMNPLLSLLSMSSSAAARPCVDAQPLSPERYLAQMMGDMHDVYCGQPAASPLPPPLPEKLSPHHHQNQTSSASVSASSTKLPCVTVSDSSLPSASSAQNCGEVDSACPLEPPPSLPSLLPLNPPDISTSDIVNNETAVDTAPASASASASAANSTSLHSERMPRLPQPLPPSNSSSSSSSSSSSRAAQASTDILDSYLDNSSHTSLTNRSSGSPSNNHGDAGLRPRRISSDHESGYMRAHELQAASQDNEAEPSAEYFSQRRSSMKGSRQHDRELPPNPSSRYGDEAGDPAPPNDNDYAAAGGPDSAEGIARKQKFDPLDFSALDEIYGYYAGGEGADGAADSEEAGAAAAAAAAAATADDSMSRNRAKAAQEVVSTEITYVEMLTVLTECVISPLRELCKKLGSRKMPSDDLPTLFGNVEEILNLHRILLTALQERYTMWTEEQKISDIFISMVPFFKMYIQYMANYSSAVETLTRCRKSYPEFAKFVDNAQLSPRFKGLQLLSLMIMPIQRVPRYILLLKQLLQYTKTTHPDYTGLEHCLSEMRSIAEHINESIRDFESQKKVMEIQSKLSARPSSLGPLIMPSRFFVAQLEVHKPGNSLSKRTIFLLNDLAILAKRINDDKYEYKDEMPLNSRGWVQQLYDDPREFIFHMVTPEKSWSLVANTIEEQDSYCALIEAAMHGRAGKRSSGASLSTPNASSSSMAQTPSSSVSLSSYPSSTIPVRGANSHPHMTISRKQFSMTGMNSGASIGVGSGAGAAIVSNTSRLSNVSLSGSTNSPSRLSGSYNSPPALTSTEAKRRSSSSISSSYLGLSSSSSSTSSTPSSSVSTLPNQRGSRTSLPPPQRKESIPYSAMPYETSEASLSGGSRPRSESGTRSSSRSSRE